MASKREPVVISIADNVGDIKEVKTGSLLKLLRLITALLAALECLLFLDWVKSKDKFLEQAVWNSVKKPWKTSDFEKVNEALFG